MRLLPVANAEAAAQLRKRPLVSVDMGFSGTTKSCGVALALPGKTPNSVSYSFANAAEIVRDFFRDHGEGVLILEAPLSAAFDAKRNPSHRGDFEREGKPRWWNLRAGSQMALAALYFCRRIDELLPQTSSVQLIEAFVVGDESGEHADVAKRIASAFIGNAPAKWHEVAAAGETISIAEWFGQPHGCPCPVVLHPTAA